VSLKWHFALLKGLRPSLLSAWKAEYLGYEVNDLTDPIHNSLAPVYSKLIEFAQEDKVSVDYSQMIDQLMKGITR